MRKNCTCLECQPTRLPPTPARGFARCSNGHDTITLTTGHDVRGKYLQAHCTTPTCGLKQVIRSPYQPQPVTA